MAQQETRKPELLKNPYKDVNWDQVTAYKANFHSHTVKSDGRSEPDELIYMYANAGYDILAITDHDNYYTHREGERDVMTPYIHRDHYDAVPTAETTWPWTRWIDEKPSQIWVYRGIESSAFYPDLGERGMLAVRGSELTTHPHIVSLFNRCGWPGQDQTDDERMSCIEGDGGLSFWAHPGEYLSGGMWDRFENWEDAVDYFGHYIVGNDSNLGVEISWGSLDRQYGLLKRLLQRYYREHDLFILSGDDNHYTSVSGDANLTIVLAEDLTEDAVRHALKSGHTFVGSRTGSFPKFNRIEVNEDANMIILDIDNFEHITWFKDGADYSTGNVLDYSGLEDAILRFEVVQNGETFYSQAFYIR